MNRQDPLHKSWRVWGAVLSTVAAALAVPEVQTALQDALGTVVPVAWAPVITALLGALGPVVSKARDTRPVRGAA